MRKCKRCGGAMVPEEVGGKLMLVCNSCGYREQAGQEERRKHSSSKSENVLVVEEEVKTAPTTHVICPYCGADRAYWWIRQTRAADEPSTRFYKCVKCGRVWREYV